YQRALECLGAEPLRADPGPAALFAAIDTGSKSVRRQPEFAPWWLLFKRPPQGRAFSDWAGVVAGARTLLADLPPARLEETEDLVAEVAAAALEEEGYLDGLETLLGAMDEEWPRRLGQAHARAVAASPNPERQLARTFVRWRQLPGFERELLDLALPEATGDLPPKRLAEVGERLQAGREEWELWLQAHPPRRAVSRAVRGVLRRGER
ncbi:MAG: hypothetical protein QOE75_1969, partial [Solirubrobacterales bacterium]|nr:hypothetical protein [Solirubrobacterales bacterium]